MKDVKIEKVIRHGRLENEEANREKNKQIFLTVARNSKKKKWKMQGNRKIQRIYLGERLQHMTWHPRKERSAGSWRRWEREREEKMDCISTVHKQYIFRNNDNNNKKNIFKILNHKITIVMIM